MVGYLRVDLRFQSDEKFYVFVSDSKAGKGWSFLEWMLKKVDLMLANDEIVYL